MYIRVSPLSIDLARQEEVFKLVDEKLIPRLRQMPGFVSYTAGMDGDAGRGVAISVWNDMEHAAELREALGSMIQEFENLGVGFEPTALYELARHVS